MFACLHALCVCIYVCVYCTYMHACIYVYVCMCCVCDVTGGWCGMHLDVCVAHSQEVPMGGGARSRILQKCRTPSTCVCVMSLKHRMKVVSI